MGIVPIGVLLVKTKRGAECTFGTETGHSLGMQQAMRLPGFFRNIV